MMKMTAERSVKASQFEIMLKLKQKENNDFEFLYPSSELHPYYTHLKNELLDMERQEKRPAVSSEAGTTILASLCNYTSSSEEEQEQVITSSKVQDVVAKRTFESDDDDETEKKAKRLRQAKALKDHFARKLKS